MSRKIYLLRKDKGEVMPSTYLTGEAVWTEEEAKEWVAETYNPKSSRNRSYQSVTLRDPPGPPLQKIVDALVVLVTAEGNKAKVEPCKTAYKLLKKYQEEALQRWSLDSDT